MAVKGSAKRGLSVALVAWDWSGDGIGEGYVWCAHARHGRRSWRGLLQPEGEHVSRFGVIVVGLLVGGLRIRDGGVTTRMYDVVVVVIR